MNPTLLDIIGHASFALTAVSFYLRDVLSLRLLAIASGLVGIVYNYSLPGGPLWLVIFWLSVFISINTVRVVGIVIERRSITLSEAERVLHETVFHNFSIPDFARLMRIAQWRVADEDHHFTEQGQPLEGLKFLLAGEVAIVQDGAELARVNEGEMIGEISFVRGGPATATVRATRPCRYLYWPTDEIRRLLADNPTVDSALRHVVSVELSRKLAGRKTPDAADRGDDSP